MDLQTKSKIRICGGYIIATWVTHLIIADRVLEKISNLCRHEFCIGNIAPDCNVENEDWTSFIPSREVTHWMTSDRKVVTDCDRFLNEYIKRKKISSVQEESFLWGYYAHLLTDAEFQRFTRDENRIKASWERIKSHCELKEKSIGMPKTWDSVKKLINKNERMYDIYSIERDYLDKHPNSGYLTEIMGLESFPDYIDYLPPNAIPRKIKVMGYMPEKITGKYSNIALSIEEYNSFLDSVTHLVTNAILMHEKENKQ